jgi:hypothetical protein
MGRPTDEYTPARLARARAGGLRWVSWGVESGAQRLLDLCDKGTHAPEIARLLRDAAAAGIANTAMMIFGLPTSTDVDFEETCRFLEAAYPSLASLTTSRFVLWEHTAFAREAKRYGLELLGREHILEAEGGAVPWYRLRFRERTGDGASRPPRGPFEAECWECRRRWLGARPLDHLGSAEHVLLHTAGFGGVRPAAAAEGEVLGTVGATHP